MYSKLTSFTFLLFLSFSLISQYSPSTLPGDGFSLEGAVELFKTSKSPEEFEKKLNTEDNFVNNLDLNEDGEIDFIRVENLVEGDVHAFVLQVTLSKKETQDIAVIELEKTGKESALLQIVGDADLYGEEIIVEPFDMEASSIGKGPNAEIAVAKVVVNVWLWPSVRYVYRPAYRPYVSPFRWGVYPRTWWKPWKVRSWTACHNYRVKYYRPHFRVVKTHRVAKAHRIYTPKRKSCTVVKSRTVRAVAVNKQKGVVVKSKKTVVPKATKRKGGTKVKTTKTKVGVGKNKKAVQRKTTTRRKRN